MRIHLVDGTYELFRSFYGPPPKTAPDGREVGATIGLIRSMLALIQDAGVTHLSVAFDHVVESFRNTLYAGYKSGEGIDPQLSAQFPLAEQAVAALGIVAWPMIEFEADDALATAVLRFQQDAAVDQLIICSPDKDLTQLVVHDRVICWDRRREIIYNEAAVIEKYGVPPSSIPDWLALVGDAADGIPGVPSWGAKSSATVLTQYRHLEAIPDDIDNWDVTVRGARRLSENFNTHRDQAFLYRRLTTLRSDVPLEEGIDDLRWRGVRPGFESFCRELGAENLLSLVPFWDSRTVH